MKKHLVAATHRVHVIYSGRVQNVGFRFTAEKIAMDLGLCGCVKNMPNGTVDLVSEGPKDKIETLLKRIQESALGPHIKKADCRWEKPTQQYSEFNIDFCF